MHRAVQTAAVTIITYKSLSDLNFTHNTLVVKSPLLLQEFISPWFCALNWYIEQMYASLQVHDIVLTSGN